MTPRDRAAAKGTWFVYILRCGDGTLYTGTTQDPVRRLAQHAAGRGARYTRGRGPFTLVYLEECPDRSQALRRERSVKRLPAPAKAELIARSRAATPGAGDP